MGSASQKAKLVVFGLIVIIVSAIQAKQTSPQGIPGYECYRTVEETYATAESIANNNPQLATWTDVGDSWEKTEGLGGYDIMVLRMTNAAITGPKPKIFITSGIHAKEYTTVELVTRFAEFLAESYGLDADVTWLLDYCEIHMILQTNPDGRKKAEAGLLWRKNTNQNYCGPTSNNRGADLNRNFPFKWNCCDGSSDDECHKWYHGAYAASEPETQAIQNYLISEVPDQSGPDDDDPVPLDASDIHLCIHSYARTIQWPWSYTGSPAPNEKQLKTLGRKLAFFNGYRPQQAYSMYPMDGNEKDFAYGELGLASYVYELGTEFFQSCSYFESTIVPENFPSLIYAMKASRAPYMLPAGPDATNLSVKSTSLGSNMFTLSATIDDTRYNNRNGTEPTQIIIAAEYYVDLPPWVNDQASFPTAMLPTNGNFDSKIEKVEANIDTSDWSRGRHILFVRGQDLEGNWGVFSAVFIDLPFTNYVGDYAIDHEWTTINLDTVYTNPVIIAGPPTSHGSDPGVVRLANVNSNSFDIRFQEWDYLDGWHTAEDISHLVMEAGRHVMDDGSIWEVGSFDLDGTGEWQTQNFSQAFGAVPHLFLTIQSYNGSQAVTVRARNITTSGFEAALFEQETLMDGHYLERVGYLAIHSPAGSGEIELTGNSYPYLLQRVTVNERWCPVLSSSLKVEEETSGDNETDHVDETVSVLALGRHLFAQMVSYKGANTAALRLKGPEFTALTEWGSVVGVTHDWVTVPLSKTYTNPVVVVKVAEQIGSDPGVGRIRNVTGKSFQARFQEWNYLDGQHSAERLFYLVAEAGSHNVAGLNFEAGKINTDILLADGWEAINFSQSFSTAPALFTSVMTYSGSDTVTTRVRNFDTTGFELALQEQESLNDNHLTETLGWIAIEQGTGTTADYRHIEALSIEADQNPVTAVFSRTMDRRFPVVLQSLSSTRGTDPAVAAQEFLTPDSVDVYVREEKSADSEVWHYIEDISIFVAE